MGAYAMVFINRKSYNLRKPINIASIDDNKFRNTLFLGNNPNHKPDEYLRMKACVDPGYIYDLLIGPIVLFKKMVAWGHNSISIEGGILIAPFVILDNPIV